MEETYSQKRLERLKHIHDYLKFDYSLAVRNIEQGVGDVMGCLRLLHGYAKAKAVLAWFEDESLKDTRQWSYTAAKLRQKYWLMKGDTTNAGIKNFELLEPLLSNNQLVINWYAHYDAIYDMRYVDKEQSEDFFAYQSIVALRAEWTLLEDRCRRVAATPSTRLKSLHGYHYFYSALSQGDKAAMVKALEQMIIPKLLRSRHSEESGFTENLIFTRIITCIKIAWLHGYEIEISSPYVPMKWMPMEPLPTYNNYYSFLAND